MKISFSPSTSYVSTSSSLTSSSSLDTNLHNNNNNSENVTATKCFSSIIRRFLCSGNQLRTHPFDSSSTKQVDPVVDQKNSKAEEKIIQAATPPGLVARLMGLDSMPHKQQPDESFGRSRSVNSMMDCRLESDKTHGHRRAKTSLSFRERPTFLELENDEFLLLSFENVGEENQKKFGGGSKSKGRRKLLSEMGCGELKENGSENRVFDQNKQLHRSNNKRNCAKQDERKISSKPTSRKDESASPGPKKRVSSNPKDRLNHRMSLKEVSDGSKLDKKKKKKKKRPALKKVEPQHCNLDNSSPVSVLDINDFEQGSNSSEDEPRKQTGLNLRSKLTPGDAAALNSDRPSIHISRISTGEIPELRTVESQPTAESAKVIDTGIEEYIQLWGEICKLTEQDMKTSIWMPREALKMEEFDEIGTEFGLEILNQLLHEITAELEQLPKMVMTNFSL